MYPLSKLKELKENRPAQISGDMGRFYVRKETYHPGMEAKVVSWDSTPAHTRKPRSVMGANLSMCIPTLGEGHTQMDLFVHLL